MTNFQIVLLSVFGFFILFAILLFSGLIPGLKGGGSNSGGTVVLWGTIPDSSMSGLLDEFNRQNKPTVLAYVEKDPDTLDRDLVETLASGSGPDLIMLPRELIYRHADKLYPIPYATLSKRDFLNTFVQEGELYLTDAGALALPFRIDPMVMYFNRDILSNAGISLPPQTWEEILAIAPKLVTKDSSGNITQSAVSFGEYGNVTHAKDIIALLAIQAGNPIVTPVQGGFKSSFGETSNLSLRSTDEAIRYYTGFSNPVQPQYSWNKSLPNSRNAFLSGALAFYFGYASELYGLRNSNPHLNFDVGRVPQAKGAPAVMTIGRIDGLAILKASQSPELAYQVATLMTGSDFALKLAKQIFLPPPRRDLLSAKPSDAYMNIFYASALISRGWVDPSSSDTSAIFRELIENVVSGRLRVNEAVTNADGEIGKLFEN